MARGTEEKTQLTVNTQGDECRHTQSEPQHTDTHMDSQSYNIVTSLLKYWEEEQQVLSAKSVQVRHGPMEVGQNAVCQGHTHCRKPVYWVFFQLP